MLQFSVFILGFRRASFGQSKTFCCLDESSGGCDFFQCFSRASLVKPHTSARAVARCRRTASYDPVDAELPLPAPPREGRGVPLGSSGAAEQLQRGAASLPGRRGAGSFAACRCPRLRPGARAGLGCPLRCSTTSDGMMFLSCR